MDQENTTQTQTTENKDNKNSMYAPLLAVAALLILGGSAFALVSTNKPQNANPTQVTPTQAISGLNDSGNNLVPTEVMLPTVQQTAPTVSTTIAVPSLNTTPALSPFATKSASATNKTFTVSASNYKFDVTSLMVNKGDTVTIKFMNKEGFHDLVIDEFNGAKTKQIQGVGEDTITFVADKTGSFEYYCSVGQHRQMGMKGTLVVK